MKFLEDEKVFKFTGDVPRILEMCGFHIRVFEPEWLMEGYDWLVTIQHRNDDPGSTVILPLAKDDEKGRDFLFGQLLATQKHLLEVLGFMMGMVVSHDQPYIEEVRVRKEQAIMDQRFDRAADLRDLERKVVRAQSLA
jgi:hypothetical protein